MNFKTFLLLLLVTSCQEKNTSSKKHTSTDEVAIKDSPATFSVRRVAELSRDLSNLREFSRSLNFYHIKAVAKDGRNLKDHKIQCSRDDFSDRVYEGFFDVEGKEAEVRVFLNTTSLYPDVFECIIRGTEEVGSEKLVIKKSLVVDTARNLGNLANNVTVDLDTLLITETGNLYVNDKNVFIKTNSLISQRGVISTFLKGSVAPPDSEGLSGGIINLRASRFLGELAVELRGQQGGDRILEGEGPGYPGGHTGAISIVAESFNEVKLLINYFPGEGGRGSQTGRYNPREGDSQRGQSGQIMISTLINTMTEEVRDITGDWSNQTQ